MSTDTYALLGYLTNDGCFPNKTLPGPYWGIGHSHFLITIDHIAFLTSTSRSFSQLFI